MLADHDLIFLTPTGAQGVSQKHEETTKALTSMNTYSSCFSWDIPDNDQVSNIFDLHAFWDNIIIIHHRTQNEKKEREKRD